MVPNTNQMLGSPPKPQSQGDDQRGPADVAVKIPAPASLKLQQKPAAGRKKLVMIASLLVVLALGLGVGLGLGLSSSSSSSTAGGNSSVVEMAFIANGDVGDFTPTVKAELKTKVGAEVGVSAGNVALRVEAASVRLTFQ